MKVEACIFDLDGVIVDTAGYHYSAWEAIAANIGFEFTEEMNETMKGISRMDSLTKLLEFGNISKTEEEKEELCKVKNDIYLESLSEMNEQAILPGVEAFLEHLQERNIKIALGSASKNAIKVLDLIGIKHFFKVIIDGNGVNKSKPDPEVFNRGAEGLGVIAQNTIVFEDSDKGLDAAIAGGFRTVGIGTIENLGKADFVMSSFEGQTIDKLITALS